MKIIRRSSEDENVPSQHPTSEPRDQFEDAVLDAYRQARRERLAVLVGLSRRTTRFLIIWFAIAVALALTGVILQLVGMTHDDGAARPQMVTVTLTTTASVHPVAGGGCTSGPSDDRVTASLWDDAGVQRVAPLSAGRLAGKACVFTATMPVLPDARWFVLDGAYHDVPTGVGAVSLSATDGRWLPVKSMAAVQ